MVGRHLDAKGGSFSTRRASRVKERGAGSGSEGATLTPLVLRVLGRTALPAGRAGGRDAPAVALPARMVRFAWGTNSGALAYAKRKQTSIVEGANCMQLKVDVEVGTPPPPPPTCQSSAVA